MIYFTCFLFPKVNNERPFRSLLMAQAVDLCVGQLTFAKRRVFLSTQVFLKVV